MPSQSLTSAMLCPALAKVAETSFFAFAEPGGGGAVPAVPYWYAASVRFRGPVSGQVTVAMPVSLAYDLASAFLGGDEVNEPIVRDLCGEFVNQVTGTWLTELDEPVGFDLDGPAVGWVEGMPEPGVAVIVNDQPVIVTLHLATESL